MKTATRTGVWAGLTTLCASTPAMADAAFPTIAWYLPPAWLLLIPVIALEAYIGERKYQIPRRQGIVSSATANILSTIVGIPFAWFAVSAAGSFGFTHPNSRLLKLLSELGWLMWIPPGNNIVYGYLSFFICMAVFLVLSIVIEYYVVKRFFDGSLNRVLRKWMCVANCASYAFLVIVIVLTMILPLANGYTERVLIPVAEKVVGLLDGVSAHAK